MTFSQIEYIVKLERNTWHLSQNGQWNFNQVGNLVKMANVIITYIPT